MQGLESSLPPAALDWLHGIDLDDKLAALKAFSGAVRSVGKTATDVTDRGAWGLDELARAWILLHTYPRITPEDLWAHGDNRERQAVLKTLPLLPEPQRFESLAVEACRSNVLTVFQAIACENPYPSRYFSEPSWNQMVLKAAFTGTALDRILGLDTRCNPELARMAADFASERRAAGRPVPEDLALLTKGSPT
jgi:hypothetical protein